MPLDGYVPPSRVQDSCRQRLWSVTTLHSAPPVSNKLTPKVPVSEGSHVLR
jgi:hypothetical protein